jgi:hypothetical protein
LTLLGATGVEFNTLGSGTISCHYTDFVRRCEGSGFTYALNFEYFAAAIDVCPYVRIPTDNSKPVLFADNELAQDAQHYALIMPLRV